MSLFPSGDHVGGAGNPGSSNSCNTSPDSISITTSFQSKTGRPPTHVENRQMRRHLKCDSVRRDHSIRSATDSVVLRENGERPVVDRLHDAPRSQRDLGSKSVPKNPRREVRRKRIRVESRERCRVLSCYERIQEFVGVGIFGNANSGSLVGSSPVIQPGVRLTGEFKPPSPARSYVGAQTPIVESLP